MEELQRERSHLQKRMDEMEAEMRWTRKRLVEVEREVRHACPGHEWKRVWDDMSGMYADKVFVCKTCGSRR